MKPKPPTFVEFCQRVGAPLSPAQEVLAGVAFDGEDVPPEAAIMFGFSGPVPAPARRTIAWLAGRGSGKTRLLALAILWRLLYGEAKLARGEIGFGVVFSPTLELSEQTLRFARGALQGTRYESAITAETGSSFTLRRPDGMIVRFTSLAAKSKGTSGRGRTLLAAAIDECCFFAPETNGAINDADVYRALPPRLVRGGFVVLASTPWTPAGLLWEFHRDQFGAPRTALVAKAPTELMRLDDPQVLADVAAERLRDPDNAARELDCEWLATGGGTAFDAASLNAAIVGDELEPTNPSDVVHVGADLAQIKDRTALIAVRDNRGVLEVIDATELRPGKGQPLSLEEIALEAADFFHRNHASGEISADHHLIEPINESLARLRVGVRFRACAEGTADREDRFARAIAAFKAGRVRIPQRFAWLSEQLSTIVATPRDGGGYRYTAPRRSGSHADGASAFLLAAEIALRGTMPTAEQLEAAAPALCGVRDLEASNVFDEIDLGLEARIRAFQASQTPPAREQIEEIRFDLDPKRAAEQMKGFAQRMRGGR